MKKKTKKRRLFSIDPDISDLFDALYKTENKSKMIEEFLKNKIEEAIEKDYDPQEVG